MIEDLDDLLGEDDLSSFLNEENDAKTEDDDLLSSFFAEEDNQETEEDDLAAFLAENAIEEENAGEEDLLAAFFDEEDDDPDLTSFFEEETSEEDEQDLASFFAEEDTASTSEEDNVLASFFEEDEDEEDTGILGSILGTQAEKPQPALPYKKEKRKAKVDITKNSKEDNTIVKRYTKREIDEQLKRDYKYMLGKPYMVIQPLTILADYPYKKKKNDSDIVGSRNVDYDYVLVIGKLLKWRSTEDFRGKAYKLGEIMYMKRGIYWVNGQQVAMEPHFAIVIHRSYKRIKSKRIRDLLAPLKQRLRSGKPFSIYKEFPIIIERTGAYS